MLPIFKSEKQAGRLARFRGCLNLEAALALLVSEAWSSWSCSISSREEQLNSEHVSSSVEEAEPLAEQCVCPQEPDAERL